MHLFYDANIADKLSHFSLNEKEAAHAIKVLRMQKGMPIQLTNGRGYLFKAEISSINRHQVEVEIISSEFKNPPPVHVHMAISPLKNTDRLEWFIEKAVEAGVSEISLIACERTEKKNVRDYRIHKIAESALKQSMNLYYPLINTGIPFAGFLEQAVADAKLIAYCETEKDEHLVKKLQEQKSVVIAIGPEGDFSPGEVLAAKKAGFTPVNLGSTRLRSETAAIAAMFMAIAVLANK